LLGTACLPFLVHATDYEKGGNVDQYFGAYTEAISLIVPPFHGIEPKLSVSYSSAGGNGLLGVGWRLQGLSEIELIDHHYELDGQWLIACTAETDVLHGPQAFGPRSPSCANAQGWYSTLSESYLRIAGAGPNNLSVWQPDGVRTDYSRVGARQKWLIDAVTDTGGNIVTYHWNTTANGFSFNTIDSITYNGTVIKFYYEARALAETYAERGNFETIDKELATIDVCVQSPGNTTPCALGGVDANRARAYALNYRSSSQTSRPLLSGFVMFGKDALIGRDGRVTSGHATPAYSFGWSDFTPRYSAIVEGNIPNWGSDWIGQMVDFNGDGRADYCRDVPGGPNDWNLKCAISTGNGFVDEWKGMIWNWGDDHSGAWVDWDGDGKADYCRIINRAIWCAFSTGAAGDVTAINDMQVGPAFAPGEEGYDGMRWFVDWNGDGRADFCRAQNHADGRNMLMCAFSKGPASAGYEDVPEGALYTQAGGPFDTRGEDYTRAIVDFNGDGVKDFCRLVRDGNVFDMWCNLGSRWNADMSRDHYVGAITQLMGTIADVGYADSQWWADVNGDGKVDYCRLTGGGNIRCAISKQDCIPAACNTTGINAFTNVIWAQLVDAGDPPTRRFGDINGDGKADFCFSSQGTVKCQISTGFSSTPSVATGAPSGGLYERNWMVDWNGDGRVDYCSNTGSTGGNGSQLSCVHRNFMQMPDLMTSVSNGIGGVTTINYTPSSAWLGFTQPPNNNPPTIPTVQSVTTPDGTQSYMYSGGRFDWYTQRFLGFGWVRATDPCLAGETQCPFTETTF
jgi:hypothetical protein